MPCYQVNLVSVVFQAKHLDLLEAAAKAENLKYQKIGTTIRIGDMQFDTRSNKIMGRSQSRINALKRAYSKAVVKKAARKNSWIVQPKGQNQYVAMKY